MDKKIKKVWKFLNGLLVTAGIIVFSFGFALFVSSIIKLLESNDPWKTLTLSLGMMILPVILGVWEFKQVKKKIMGNLKKLKVE